MRGRGHPACPHLPSPPKAREGRGVGGGWGGGRPASRIFYVLLPPSGRRGGQARRERAKTTALQKAPALERLTGALPEIFPARVPPPAFPRRFIPPMPRLAVDS